MDLKTTSAGSTEASTDESAIEALVGLPPSHETKPTEAANSGGAVAAAVGSGSGRLSALVPTLGRMASRAHKASAPYLTYAAMASQEAARYVGASK